MFDFRPVTHLLSRRPTRMVAIGAVLVATAAVPGARAATAGRGADLQLSYACALPSGSQPIDVRLVGDFPSTGSAGRPIRLGTVTTTVTLPRAALAEVTKLDATAMTAGVRLTTEVGHNGTWADAQWRGFAAPLTPIDAAGDTVITASGAPPSVTVDTAGDVSFTAKTITLRLAPRKADGSVTDPATLELKCEPDPNRSATFLTLPVTNDGTASEPGRTPAKNPGTGITMTNPTPKSDVGIPDDCDSYHPPDNQQTACAFLVGVSNVTKLNGATILGRPEPLYINIAATSVEITPPGDDGISHIITVFQGNFNYKGQAMLPPAKATFLTFGFMPTTATMELSQVGLVTINSDLEAGGEHFKVESTATSDLMIRLTDVTVNGTPLDVGPRCQTSSPMELKLEGHGQNLPLSGYTVQGGGPMDGTAKIPPFRGCGAGEDLDPLFTSSISGTENYTRMIQGSLCSHTSPEFPCTVPDEVTLPPDTGR